MRYTVPDCRVVKGSAWADGLGSGTGQAKHKAVIYDAATGSLVAVGDEILIEDGAPASWVELTFSEYPGGVELAAGDYDFGTIVGGDNDASRFFFDLAATNLSRRNVDAYADGPSATFGAPDENNGVEFSIFWTYFLDWLPPTEGVTEEQLARLPFELTQRVFGARGSSPTGIRGNAGWYGTITDPEVGAFAIVKAGSNMEQLLGERIRVRVRAGRGSRSVFVYVHSMTDDLGDPDIEIALSRRAFQQIGHLAATMIPVEIELAPAEAEE